MDKKRLLKGAEAIGEAALRSGCTRFYGYPVPNQSDLMEYLIREENEGRGLSVFQSEDPLSGLFMAYGATLAGARVLTAVNSIDIPDALRALSYFNAAELPLVCVVFTQSGPGSGNIYPEQSDTLALLYGARAGDGFAPLLTPSTPTTCAAATYEAFRMAETYRLPVILLVDAACAQLEETVDLSAISFRDIPKKREIIGGQQGQKRVSTTLHLDIDTMAEKKELLQNKKALFLEKETGTCLVEGEGAEILLVAYGISAVQAKRAADALVADQIPCALFQPTSLYPFPEKAFTESLESVKHLYVIDMSDGQLKSILAPYVPESLLTHHFESLGGSVPRVEDLRRWIRQTLKSS